MTSERSLATLIRSLHIASTPQDAYALLPSATGLLTLLTNPLNVTLLASQLLVSPALWDHGIDLQGCRRIMSAFNTAAITILHNEEQDEPRTPASRRTGLDREEWVKAVVGGADEKSPRWRHLLLLGGVLLGFEGQNRQGLPITMKTKLESALVKAAQLSLQERDPQDRLAGYCVVFVLNHCFELLSDFERTQIDYDLLLPTAIEATYLSPEGLEAGYFLGAIDRDVKQVDGQKFNWSPKSPTFVHVREVTAKPLISSLGPLSRLIAHAVENARDPDHASTAVDSLATLVRTLIVQWRQNKLSEVDAAEEAEFLDQETVKETLPTLWRLLRTSMFSTVIVLRAVLGRTLNDPVLAAGRKAPYLAIQCLHILRNFYFVTSRLGQNASSQYTFVNLTAIDILSQYPELAENFLRTIRPSEPSQIPQHPVERCLDLFFLNTAEHFSLILSPESNEELLMSAALPYLAAGGNNHLLQIFEAAHSVTLAVLAAPRSADMAAKHLPFYVDTLFAVFPQNLSARQFRLAYKMILQITAPPSPLANSQPHLPSILLELVYHRALHAPSTALPPTPPNPDQAVVADTPPLSEQAVLTLTLIDCLCFLPVDALEDWLPLTAQLIRHISDAEMKRNCQERFWEMLSGGEMDVERANFCVIWWSTRGGRELTLFGIDPAEAEVEADGGEAYMSGALIPDEPRSKL